MQEVRYCTLSQVDDSRLKYAVVIAQYEGKWLLVRNRARDTWESPGGRREPGEDIHDTARRELWEETGALAAEMELVSYYQVEDFGALFFARITQLGPLPEGFEIAERRFCQALPHNLTYPDMHPSLFHKVQGWLNMQTGKGELWDVFDGERRLTGRQMRRGEPIPPGDYHLVVYAWTENAAGQFLLTRRSPIKGFPNMWECTGGSALAGEDSLTAAVREVREETGLVLAPENGRFILSYRREDAFCDVWLFRQEFDLGAVKLLEGETTAARAATREEIRALWERDELVPYPYFQTFFEKI